MLLAGQPVCYFKDYYILRPRCLNLTFCQKHLDFLTDEQNGGIYGLAHVFRVLPKIGLGTENR